eukprot:scaffold396_cov339-Prasinococcus_capsulatus_cf.AAC.17
MRAKRDHICAAAWLSAMSFASTAQPGRLFCPPSTSRLRVVERGGLWRSGCVRCTPVGSESPRETRSTCHAAPPHAAWRTVRAAPRPRRSPSRPRG